MLDLDLFWKRYPALFYGLVMLLGTYAAFFLSPYLLFPLSILIASLCVKNSAKTFCIFLILFASAFSYTYFHHCPPETSCLSGEALFEISSLTLKNQHGTNKWIYKGLIRSFKSVDGQKFYNVPCSLSLTEKEGFQRPLANRAYAIQGRLKRFPSQHFSFVCDLHHAWLPIPYTLSLAEHRYFWKKKLSGYLANHYQESHVSNFLKGLATGDFTDKTLSFQLARFGLQHIMAISGFHFALVAAIFHFIFKCVTSDRLATYFLLLSLSLYYIFLGCSPSIMRAWISIMVFLIGYLLHRKGSALNSLGLSLIIILLFNPHMSAQIGFQMSFLATAAILLISPLLDERLALIYKTRPLSTMIEMNHLNQWAYCVLILLRKSIALTLSVLVLTLPLSLFYFSKFPLLSILYNLFFPFLTSVSMTLLIFGLLVHFLSPDLAAFLHSMNSSFTKLLLNFAYNIPRHFDKNLESSLSQATLTIFLALILFSAFRLHQNRILKQTEPGFAFI